MEVFFNILILGLVGLIAYWWANQGLFSAILHLLCVIAAGAVALAFWEPLVTGLLLHNTFFDNYAWGAGLVIPFVIVLLILRVIFDKMCGANVDVPRWANLTFGGAVGAAAGVLTMGIFVIGAGFMQSSREIMGFTGYARSRESRAEVKEIQSMWVPVHTITANFYSMLSAGALYPTFERTPLNRLYPQLDRVALSLHRDSFNNGRGRTTVTTNDVRVLSVLDCQTCSPKRYAVELQFLAGARDYGEQLTVSSSQIRLIGAPPSGASPFTEAKVAYPREFTEYSGHYKFDDISHYIISEAGQENAQVIVEFNASDLGNQTPKYIQIRGTRFLLPRANTPQWQVMDQTAYTEKVGTEIASSGGGTAAIDSSAIDISTAITISRDIRPISMSVNKMWSGLDYTKVDDRNWLSGGKGLGATVSPDRPARGLEIAGIFQPAGTRIVQVDVSRSSPANIFDDKLLLQAEDTNPEVQLVDSGGGTYPPVGYIWTQPGSKTEISLDYQKYLRRFQDLPALPTADTHRLKLLFVVTEGRTIAGLKMGKATVGSCSVTVQDPNASSGGGGGLQP